MGRIVDYSEITILSNGDYLIVDNSEGGTKKVSAQLVAGTVDPTPTEGSTNAVSSGGVWTSLNDISEEFEALRSDAYDVYPKGSASGEIVQFETGADNVPLYDLTGYIHPTMSGSGMPSRTNIRTISGPDDINIYQRNKNLIEQITYQAEPETVYLGVQNSSNLTMFFKAGDYRITVNIVGGSTVEPYWAIGSTATHSEYMHLDKDTNVSIYVYDADGISASDIESFQVEVGTEATDHVEFEGDITNVVLPTDRGTIYSGRVALTAGKVYIDAVIYERNSSTMNNTEDKPGWAYIGLQTYDVAIGTFDDVIYWPNGDVRCTNVNVGSTYSVEAANEDYSLILPRDVYNMSQSQWISAAVDIQILVKLSTPIEIDIDPVEVRSLYGFNTYYCNSGKTGVIFGMDLAKHISDKTTEIQKEEQAKLEKAFATDTASGAVVTFADGADDIPMKSVKVAIEPVQDLHGYDHPWPAGGGKNLIPYTTKDTDTKNGVTWTKNSDGSISFSGTVTAAVSLDFINFKLPAGSYLFSNVGSTASYSGGSLRPIVYIRDLDNATTLALINFETTNDGVPFTLSVETNVGFYMDLQADNTVTGTLYPMVRLASVSDSTYAPYSNICPISGFTEAKVARTGKNLLSPDVDSYTSSGSYRLNSNVVPNGANAIMTFTDKDTSVDVSGCNIGFVPSDYSKSMTSPKLYRWCMEYGVVKANTTNRATQNTSYFCDGVLIYPKDIATFNKIFSRYNIMVELGSTATEYEPYTGDTYSITLPTEAGTVYGGELDVTNGTLTVDRAMVDLGTLDWSYNTSHGVFYSASIDTLVKSNGECICDRYAYGNVGSSSADKVVQIGRQGWFDKNVIVKDSAYSDAVTFKTAMSGVQLVYELATPITYHLTPTEIKSLLGDNNVWADAGNTTVTYRADATKYIDKKIAEVINALS